MALVPCEDCSGLKDEDRFSIIALKKYDPDGVPVLDPDGVHARTYIRLPFHIVEQSRLDPTGLAPAACRHGLPEHPDPAVQKQLWRLATTWVRSRYLDYLGRCPACREEPVPDDMTTPANA